MATVGKIKASGLPQRTWEELDEPLVTASLEGMAEQTDPGRPETGRRIVQADGP